jgi:hypothetical protein
MIQFLISNHLGVGEGAGVRAVCPGNEGGARGLGCTARTPGPSPGSSVRLNSLHYSTVNQFQWPGSLRSDGHNY